MLSVLVHHGIEAVDIDYPTDTSEADKARIAKRAYHTISLHFPYDVLTSMNHVTTAEVLWKTLEFYYLK